MNIKILKAGQGDSILIRFCGDDGLYKNILIDGGNSKNEYKNHLKQEILQLQESNEFIDLLIITHTDQDHVKGIQYLLNDIDVDKQIFKEVWFNSFNSNYSNENGDISYRESCKIQELINRFNISRTNNITINDNLDPINFYGANITILSPFESDINKLMEQNDLDIGSGSNDYKLSIHDLIEQNPNLLIKKVEDLDFTLENRVSIAFLIETHGKSLLFLGDANPDVVEKSVEKLINVREIQNLNANYIKLSHHASVRSLSFKMLDLIKSNNFIVSTTRTKSNLPNKITFAKILNSKFKESFSNFIFNYGDDEMTDDKKLNFTLEEMKKYNFTISKPNYKHGYLISYE